MRADQFDAAVCQSFAQRIAVGGAIADQAFGTCDAMAWSSSGLIRFTSAGLALAMSRPSGRPVSVGTDPELVPLAE